MHINNGKFTIIFFLICFCFAPYAIIAQNNLINKANELYKAKRFADAIPLYKEALELDLNKSVLKKLGDSYRMINKNKEALKNYDILMAQPDIDPRVHLIYIELLILNENYKKAEKSLGIFKESENYLQQVFVLKSMINNNYNIQPLFKNVSITPFEHNTPNYDENSPFFSKSIFLFSSDRTKSKTSVKKKSGWTGRGYYQVWASQLEGKNYAKPSPYNDAINASQKNTANAFIDFKNQEIFFTKNDNEKDKSDFYNMQLYSSKIKKGKFSKAIKHPVCVSEYNYMHACLSPDGQKMYYVSDRPGKGGTDIFVSKRTADGWSRGKNLGDIINTKNNEGFPFIDQDGNLYFCSKGHSGLGGYDIYISVQDEAGNWSLPKNLGRPFNGPHDDFSILISKSGKGAFCSSRKGSDDIYLFQLTELKD